MDFEITHIILLLLAGTIGGFMAGLLGIGGGIIFVPILDFVFRRYGVHDDEIVRYILANSLFIIMFTGVGNSIKQYRIKNFYPKQILRTAIPAIVSALVMTFLIQVGTWYSKEKFNMVFLALLSPLVIRMLYHRKKVPAHDAPEPANNKFSIVGFFTGFITALSGLGGGVIMVPFFTDFLKVDIKKATSISAGVVTILAFSVVLRYISTTPVHPIAIPHIGYITYPIAIPIIIGTLLSVGFGVSTAQKAPSTVIKTIFALFTLLVISKVVYETFFQ